MKIELIVKDGYIQPVKPEQIKELKDGIYIAEVKHLDTRTILQNKSLHLYFKMVADMLNYQNISIAMTIKPDIKWTGDTVKELLWNPIQKAATNKSSSTKLNKDEITKVYDILNKLTGEKFGFNIDFPNKNKI